MIDIEDFKEIPTEYEKLETPYFLLDGKKIRDNCLNFLNAFRFCCNTEKIRAYYSVKTNYELAVLKIINKWGLGAEISSGMELTFARKAGFDPRKIIFDGPCKRSDEILEAIEEGIYLFNLDSINDAKAVSQVLSDENFHTKWKVCFRVNPKISGHITALAERYISKFGVPIDEARKAYDFAIKDRKLEVVGINTHIGSQILSPKYYLKTIDKIVDLAKYIESRGIELEEINLGGGFPSQTLMKTTLKSILFKKESNVPRIQDFAKAIGNHLDGFKRLKSDPYLAFEPGRYIVGNAGIYVTRVVDKKGKWLFIDGSINHIPENIFFASRKMYSAKKESLIHVNVPETKYMVSGRTLNTGDILSLGEKFKDVKIGDYVIIQDCGAYTISKANQFTTLRPDVYLIKEDGKREKIRRKENYNDILRLMKYGIFDKR